MQSWDQQLCYSRDAAVRGAWLCSCPRSLWKQGQLFPENWEGMELDPRLGAGSSTSPAAQGKRGITQSKTQLCCSSRSRGLQTKMMLLGKEERKLEKTDEPWSKEQGTDVAVPCPAAFSHGFCRCFDYPGQGMKDQLCTGALLPGVTSSVGHRDTGTPALLPNPCTHSSPRAGGSHILTLLWDPELSLPPCLSEPSFADFQRWRRHF